MKFILVHKYSGLVYKNAVVVDDKVYSDGGIGSSFGPLGDYYVYHSNAEVQRKIESAVEEHNQAMQDTLQGYYDNEQQLLEQIEELKAKVPQPIEVSQELADALVILKSYSLLDVAIIYKATDEFWIRENTNNELKKSFLTLNHEIFNTPTLEPEEVQLNILSALKNGYTVKPDPLREGIASLVARYTNDDGIKDETDLINQLVDYAKEHFKE